jgi:hypothetical protein
VLLVHRSALGRPVDLARGEEDETLDGRAPDRVEEDLRPLHVGRDELGGALLDRLLDVRLGGRVHDHVHVRHDLADEVRVADVAVDEGQPLVPDHVGEVVHVARVRQRIERDDVVRGRREQVAHEVGGDEPGAPGDQHPLAQTSSLSIV